MAFAARLSLTLIAFVLLACGDDGGSADTTPAASSDSGATSATSVSASGTDSNNTSSSGGATDTIADESTGGGLCISEHPAIVTDIDETLTLSDAEFIMQIGDGTYDPVEREGGAELITAYADLGYRILYLTARSEEITIKGTNETAREATERWLDEHGFPRDPETTALVLAPMFVVGDPAEAYKTEALATLQEEGWRFDYAYGNATSDIGAYASASIPLQNTFIIGEHAGASGTMAVEGEGWVEHHEAHVPSVPEACTP